MLRRDLHTCAYCSGPADTVDHLLPQSRGGLNTWLNTVAACTRCNNLKANRTPARPGCGWPGSPGPDLARGLPSTKLDRPTASRRRATPGAARREREALVGRRAAAVERQADPQRHRLLGRLLPDRHLRAGAAALPPGADQRQPLPAGRARRLAHLRGDHRGAGRDRRRVLAARAAARHVRRGQVRLALLVGRQAVGPRPDRDRRRSLTAGRPQRRARGTAGPPVRPAGHRGDLHRAAARRGDLRLGRRRRDAAAHLPAVDIATAAVTRAIFIYLGYRIGEPAVRVVEIIGRYSWYLSIALLVGIFFNLWRQSRARRAGGRPGRADSGPAPSPGRADPAWASSAARRSRRRTPAGPPRRTGSRPPRAG